MAVQTKWVVASVALMLAAAAAGPAMAQRGRGGRPPMMMGGGGFGTALFLLAREDVQKELELLDDQIADLQKLRDEYRNSMREVFRNLRDLSPEQRRAKLEEFNKKIQAQIDEVLLPHQSKRLAQLSLQLRMRGGLEGLMRDEQIMQKLGITESQKEKLREKARQLQEELAKKVAELRKQMQEKLTEELTPQQRAKLKELIGEPFDFQSGPPPARFGGRRPRGR